MYTWHFELTPCHYNTNLRLSCVLELCMCQAQMHVVSEYCHCMWWEPSAVPACHELINPYCCDASWVLVVACNESRSCMMHAWAEYNPCMWWWVMSLHARMTEMCTVSTCDESEVLSLHVMSPAQPLHVILAEQTWVEYSPCMWWWAMSLHACISWVQLLHAMRAEYYPCTCDVPACRDWQTMHLCPEYWLCMKSPSVLRCVTVHSAVNSLLTKLK